MEQNGSRNKQEALAALAHAERQLEMIYFNSSIRWRNYRSALDGIESMRQYFRNGKSSSEEARAALAEIRGFTKDGPATGTYEEFKKDLAKLEQLL